MIIPSAIFEYSKVQFLNRNFSDAFSLLRSCLSSDSISDDSIISFLKGNTGYSIENSLTVKFAEDNLDKEYTESVQGILDTFDCIIDIDNEKHHVGYNVNFNLDKYDLSHECIKLLHEKKGQILKVNEYPILSSLSDIVNDIWDLDLLLSNCPYFVFYDDTIYCFFKFNYIEIHDYCGNKALINSLMTTYDSPLDAIKQYRTKHQILNEKK